VNGIRAILSVPESWHHGEVAMKIPRLPDGRRFTIWASKIKDYSTVLQIYKSAMFAGSDSLRNRPLADIKLFERTNANGKALYLSLCSSCHAASGRFEGPTIQNMIAARSPDWLYRFFTDASGRSTDSFHQKMKRAFNNVECPTMKMTKQQAVAIFYYIKSER
jgi:hypothetical protein